MLFNEIFVNKQVLAEMWWVLMTLLAPSALLLRLFGCTNALRRRMNTRSAMGVVWTLIGSLINFSFVSLGLCLSVYLWEYQPFQEFITKFTYAAVGVERTASAFDMQLLASKLMAMFSCFFAIPAVIALFGAPVAALCRHLYGRVQANPASRRLNVLRMSGIAVLGVFFITWMVGSVSTYFRMFPMSTLVEYYHNIFQSITF